MISIIVPVYNVEEEIGRCIDSILAQTYREIEIILINDGSTDNSGKICDEYAQKDSRIVVIHQNNQGASSARNTGIKCAKGDFIGFVDSDDIIDADMYELLLHNMIKYECDISHCGYSYLKEDDCVDKYGTGKKYIYNGIEGLYAFIDGKLIEPGLVTKLFKRELFENIELDHSIKINEDFLMNYYLFKKSKKSVFMDVCKYKYICRKNSVTNSGFSRNHFDLIKVSEVIINDSINNSYTDDKLINLCIKKKVISCFSLINKIIVNKKFEEEFNSLRLKILSYKDNIYKSNYYSIVYKVSTAILQISPLIYTKIVKCAKKIKC